MTEPNAADRDYLYVAKTFDAPGLTDGAFVDVMHSVAVPEWRRLHAAGLIESVQVLQKVGDINLQTSTQTVRDWKYFTLIELSAGVDAESVVTAEQHAGIETFHLAKLGIQYLSEEILVRPRAAGTAIPRPSPRWPSPPQHQLAAIEYIYIDDAHWEEYRRFMKQVMGPVGARLVELGDSYQIQIMERMRTLRHDASLPEWNRIHVLWGEFDDPHEGFFAHTTQAVRTLLGPEHDIESALSAANAYRVKPRMSKNRRVEALCLPPVQR